MHQKSLLSHTKYVIINRLALPLGAFIILIFIGRTSPDLLGEYALVTTYFFIMQTIPVLGLTTFVMREIARKPQLANTFLPTLSLITLVACLPVNLVIHYLLPYTHYSADVIEAIKVVGLTIFSGVIVFLAEIILTSLHKTRAIALFAIFENILRVILSLLALHYYADIVSLIWVLFITRTIAMFSYYFILKKADIAPLKHPPSIALIKKIIKIVLPFLINAILLLVISRMDFIVLSIYETVDKIGHYAIGYRIYDICMLIISSLLFAVFPWISRKFKGVRSRFITSIRIALIIFITLLWPLAVLGSCLATWYVYLFFPTHIENASLLAQLFILLLSIGGIDLALSAILHAVDEQKKDTYALTFGSFVYVILLFIFIPIWHIYGALLSAVFALLTQLSLRFYFIQQVFPTIIQPQAFKSLVYAALSVVCLYVFVYPLPLYLQIMVIAIFGLIFFPALLYHLDLFHPLRWLCYYIKPNQQIQDINRFSALLSFIAADVRQDRRQKIKLSAPFKTNLMGMLCYRVSRFCYLKKYHRLLKITLKMNHLLFKCDLPAEYPLQKGLVLVSSAFILNAENQQHQTNNLSYPILDKKTQTYQLKTIQTVLNHQENK